MTATNLLPVRQEKMKFIKMILGLICLLLGTLPSHVMYARSGNGDLWDLQLYASMFLAAVAAFLTFSLFHFTINSVVLRLVIGTIGSYVVFIILLFVISSLTGDSAELGMWMPIILIFGIPFMAPIVAMSGLGSVIVFGLRT